MLFNKYFTIVLLLAVQYSFQDSASNEDVSLSEEKALELDNVEDTTLPDVPELEVTQPTNVGFFDKFKKDLKNSKEKAKKIFEKTQSKLKNIFKKFKRDLNEDNDYIEKRSLLKTAKNFAGKQLKKQASKLGEKLLGKLF